jgi:hypothetical protein
MAGLEPAVHANTGQVEFAWIPAARAGMTVEVLLLSWIEDGRDDA